MRVVPADRVACPYRHRSRIALLRCRCGRAGPLPLALATAGVACIAAGVVLVPGPAGPADVGTVATVPVAAVLPAPRATRPAGTVPVAVSLPAHGVSAPVVPTGTDPGGGLAVPDPPTTVGWWAPGVLAGSAAGTTVLAGHVDSAVAGLGTFAVLRRVGVGERVELRGADGRTLAYRVTGRRETVKAALPADLFATTGPPRLVLVTCGGHFDRTTRNYADNVIVYAEPVP